jgi:hypothetical protein
MNRFKLSQKYIYVIIFVLLLYSCVKNDDTKISINNLNDNEILLTEEDYKIINYSENENEIVADFYIKWIRLDIEIINIEKIIHLNNIVDPVIYLKYNNSLKIANGKELYSTSFPENFNYLFIVDENKNIVFSENNIISIGGFEIISRN